MFLIVITIFLALCTVLYAFSLLLIRKGLTNLKDGKNRNKTTVTVVVAARDEEANIGECLSALVAQDYPREKLEIIVVDDRSRDATPKIVEAFGKKHRGIKLFQIPDRASQLAPKKRALDLGIRHASGEIMLTTDADCRPGPGWVSGMVKLFEPGVGLVAGFSPLEIQKSPKSLLGGLMALDSLSLACLSAAGIGLGYPLSCTGRNLAYRREVYFQMGGFQKIGSWVSGDDDLFLHLVSERTPWGIRYATDEETYVPAKPAENLREFLHQRIRHASKGRYYHSSLKWMLVVFYLYNLILLFTVPFSLLNLIIFPGPVLALIAKICFEFLLISKGARLFKKTEHLSLFPLAVLLHVPYVVIFGTLGQLGRFRWKGEKFGAQLRKTPEAIS